MINIQQAHVIDGYKLGHAAQYIENTNFVFANMTPRDDRLARVIKSQASGKMVFAGAQMAIMIMIDNWNRTFFSKPKDEVIAKFARRLKNYLGSDHGDFQIQCMADLHDLGYLPLEIKTLAEGSRVNMKVPVLTVKNTHAGFWWLVNYCETYLSCEIWPMCNAASLAEQYYLNSKRFGELTSDDSSIWLGIANHCFAARGHRGMHDAMISGMGQLLFSYGTDTLWAIDGYEEYYGANSDEELIACSVNATEHATTTQRIAYFRNQLGFTGELEAEVESLRDLLTNEYPTGILSYVADSEDYYGLLEKGLPQLKDVILNRKPDGNGLVKFVLRPDSSPKTPLEVICGDPEADPNSAEGKGSLQLLWDIFGGTVNSKGYRVINPMVGLIYGEAITIELQEKIYQTMLDAGWCVTNILMGTGSWGFLEGSSRDSYGIAIKGTHSRVDGVDVSMQKTPKTARSFKQSAKGLLRVEKEGDDFVLYDEQTLEQEQQGELKVVMRNSDMIRKTTLKEMRRLTMG